jgi:hypothetical protein
MCVLTGFFKISSFGENGKDLFGTGAGGGL